MKLKYNSITSLDLIFIISISFAIGFIYFAMHKPDINSFADNYYRNHLKKDEIIKLDGISKIHESYYKVYAGILALIGIYLTWRRTNALDIQNSHTSEQNTNSRINNENNYWLAQFSKASDLLKDDSVSAKISGVYLFEKIMNNCEEYHWPVIEILSAYVREFKSINKFYKRIETEVLEERNTFSIEYQDIMQNIKNGVYQKRMINDYERRYFLDILPNFDTFEYEEYLFANQDIDSVCKAIIQVLADRNLNFELQDNMTVEELYQLYAKALRENKLGSIGLIINKLERSKRINLSYCYFNNFKAYDKSFFLFDFTGSIFNNLEFSSSNFNFASLKNTLFTNYLTISSTDFYNVNFQNAIFTNNIEISDCYFDYSNMEHTIISHTHIQKCSFQGIRNLFSCNFPLSVLKDCNFKASSLPTLKPFSECQEITNCINTNGQFFNMKMYGEIQTTDAPIELTEEEIKIVEGE